VDAAGARLAIFRPVPGCVKLFSTVGATFYMVGGVFAAKQRLKLGVKRQYSPAVVFA